MNIFIDIMVNRIFFELVHNSKLILFATPPKSAYLWEMKSFIYNLFVYNYFFFALTEINLIFINIYNFKNSCIFGEIYKIRIIDKIILSN